MRNEKPTQTHRVKEKLKAIADLIRLDRQYGTLLVMIPTFWSLFVASRGSPSLKLCLIFSLGSFLMRSAGCAINDIADRNLDGHVERTQNRPLPSGRLSPLEAFSVSVFLVLIAFFLALMLPLFALALTPIGVGLAILYPFAKRYIPLPQTVLGVAFSWGALIAWAAVRNEISLPALLIAGATVSWATGYDTVYALMDREDDLKAGIRSSAIFFGRYTWVAVGGFYVTVIILLSLLGRFVGLGRFYFFALFLTTFLLLYQTMAVRETMAMKGGPAHQYAFILFKSNVGVGLLVLMGIFFDMTLRR